MPRLDERPGPGDLNASVLPTASLSEPYPIAPEGVVNGGSASGHSVGNLDPRHSSAVEISGDLSLVGGETRVASYPSSTTQRHDNGSSGLAGDVFDDATGHPQQLQPWN